MIEAAGHRWFGDEEFSHYWINGFCITFIAERSVCQVEETLRSSATAASLGPDEADQLFAARLIDSAGGSIVLEHGGYAGYMDRVATALSRNTRIGVVVHFSMGSSKFALVENGVVVSVFHIMDPEGRGGTSPDLLLPELTEAGLLGDHSDREPDEEDDEEEPEEGGQTKEQVIWAVSLASRLSGVPLTRWLAEDPRHVVSLRDLHQSSGESTRFINWYH